MSNVDLRAPGPAPEAARAYDIILADPPWRFNSNSEAKPGRNAMRHYPCMTDKELMALPVASWAKKPSLLFLWTTPPLLERSLAVGRKWGFSYTTQMIWPKRRIGTGYWVRAQHEIVLIMKRGRFPRPAGKAPLGPSLIPGDQTEHSRKPPTLHQRIEAAWPTADKLELFARQGRLGWYVMGNQTDRFVPEQLPVAA